MTSAKLGAVVMAALVLMYVALLGQKGYLFLLEPNPVAKVIGGSILVIPVVGAWAIYRELRFGLAIEKLGKLLENEGNWPRFRFGVLPSGRANKAEALQEFQEYKDAALADEDNWRKWFALGLIYDACGDRKRARSAMRQAIERSQR
jgi:tetratricopeptide (TPR) repeat protein